MHLKRLSVALLVLVSGCGGGSEDPPVDAKPTTDAVTPDSTTPDGAVAATGTPCDDATPCPGDAYCVALWGGSSEGVCADRCSSTCSYDGPGEAICAEVGESTRGCLISCGGADPQASCPAGMGCFDVEGTHDGLEDTCFPPPPSKYATLAADDVAKSVSGLNLAVDLSDDELVITLLLDDAGGDGMLIMRVPRTTAPGTHIDCSSSLTSPAYSEPGGSNYQFRPDTPCDIRIDQLGAVGGIVSGAFSARMERPTSTSTKRFVNATFWGPRGADVP